MQRERVSVSAMSRDEVLAKLTELKAQWQKTPKRKRDSAGLTLGMYLDSWVSRNKSKVAPSTYKHREQHIRLHIKPSLGTRRLSDLSVRHVEKMLSDIVNANFTARTASHVKATLRAALQDALREGLVSKNVALLSRSPRPKVIEQKALTAEQSRKLIDSTKGKTYGSLWLIAIQTGLRAGELTGLSWADVDLVGRKLHVRAQWGKGYTPAYELGPLKTEKSRRVIPLSDESVGVLSEMRDSDIAAGHSAGSDAVFHDAAYDRLHPTRLAGHLRAALSEASLPIVRLHDLRHTAASIWIGAGVDIKTVSELLGHSTPITTLNVYAHTDERRKKDAIETMNKAMNGSDID
jgi:integrase